MVFTGTFWKNIRAKKFCQEERLPCSQIMQSVKQTLPETSMKPQSSQLWSVLTENIPTFTRRTLPQAYSKELTGNIPRLFRKKKELGKAGFRVIVFEPLPSTGVGHKFGGSRTAKCEIPKFTSCCHCVYWFDPTVDVSKIIFCWHQTKIANAPHFLSCSNLIKSKTTMTPQQQSQKPGWCRYYFAKSPSLIGKIQVFHMGLSENRVYSQWNSHLIGIMIINHWV